MPIKPEHHAIYLIHSFPASFLFSSNISHLKPISLLPSYKTTLPPQTSTPNKKRTQLTSPTHPSCFSLHLFCASSRHFCAYANLASWASVQMGKGEGARFTIPSIDYREAPLCFVSNFNVAPAEYRRADR